MGSFRKNLRAPRLALGSPRPDPTLGGFVRRIFDGRFVLRLHFFTLPFTIWLRSAPPVDRHTGQFVRQFSFRAIGHELVQPEKDSMTRDTARKIAGRSRLLQNL